MVFLAMLGGTMSAQIADPLIWIFMIAGFIAGGTRHRTAAVAIAATLAFVAEFALVAYRRHSLGFENTIAHLALPAFGATLWTLLAFGLGCLILKAAAKRN